MVSYYESGKVRWEQFIKNGVNLDGYTYLSWFEDGTKEAELEYLNGRMIKRKNYNRSGVMVNFEELDPQTNRLVKRI
jgi:antitoxin component YwqK of YwqJK toxin-antitoxin module